MHIDKRERKEREREREGDTERCPTLRALALTSLVSSSTRLTSGAIALASIAVYFPLVVIVILK